MSLLVQTRTAPPDDDVDRVVSDTPPLGVARRADVAVLTAVTLALWAATIALARAWALFLDATGHRLVLFTPPVLGGYRPALPDRFWLPMVVAAVSVAALPVIARRLRFASAVLATTAVAASWWVALAQVDGVSGFTQGLEWDREYAPAVGRAATDPVGWLRGFVDAVPQQSIQVRAHPPALPFVFGLLDRLGARGQGVAVAVVIVVALSGVAAVAVTVRELAGTDISRRVLPFLALAPLASWTIVSFDALYLGVGAWMVALFVLATGRRRRRMAALAVGSGVLAAITVLLSYGLVLLGAILVLAAWHRRAWRALVLTLLTAGALLVALVPLGYWWPAGLAATRTAYTSFGLDRPYGFSLVADLGALALVIGPATAVGLARLRDRRLWVLVGGSLLAVVVADLSGLSKLEVERIWLPFAVWLLVATAALGPTARAVRTWLVAQASAALVLTALVSTYW